MSTLGSKNNLSHEERRENKLYVGNLDHRVTEYHVIKMFETFGKIMSEEYVWHTHGPKKGEPRGFAFVEFSTREEAEKAKLNMNGKLAFGRPLVVRFVDEKLALKKNPSAATHLPIAPAPSIPSQTTRNAKIAAIRNKLRSMENEDVHGKKSRDVKRMKTSI